MAIEWYSCANCGKAFRSGNGSPSSRGCPNNGGWHDWYDIGEIGSDSYSCGNCGAIVQSDSMPSSRGCPNGGWHDWNRL